jgi:hypothetical protein
MILSIGSWRRLALGASALVSACLLIALLAWGVITACANRSVPEPTVAEKQLAYERAKAWIRQNESAVLNEGNVALWWFLSATADVMDDAYLHELVKRYIDDHYAEGSPSLVWLRMVAPQVPAWTQGYDSSELVPYQKFFLHAINCQPVSMVGGDTSIFLRQNMCSPQVSKVLLGEAACTTHHLMGIHLYKRSRCEAPVGLPELESQLFDDVQTQLTWDPRVRDAYVQRVLVLQWFGRSHQVKPVWLRRVMSAQLADGGWAWSAPMPEVPSLLQGWSFGRFWRGVVLQQPLDDLYVSDFHPTAQGLLLMALSLRGK